jgi:uncharacterized protein
MKKRSFSHVIGFDDAPPRSRPHAPPGAPRQRSVLVVGAAFAGGRLEGVLSTHVRRDGAQATQALARAVEASQFARHLQLVMLQGITLAGFNVVDIHALADALRVPVLVVARRAPDLDRIRRVLSTKVPGGARKWALIERAGPMERVRNVFVQRADLTLAEADEIIGDLARNGNVPEPLRTAHLIAGGIARGASRGRT